MNISHDTTPPRDYEPPTDLDWPRSTLDEIMRHFGSDKSSLDHGYCAIYDAYFRTWRLRHVKLLEIGVACGASLKGWSRYFPNGGIVGADIRPECIGLCAEYDHIEIEIGDATKRPFGERWDIVIDDGSHVSQDIADAFKIHWPLVMPHGIYAIEDTRCTWSGYRTHLQPDEARYDRQHYTEIIDGLMRACDAGLGVEFVHHYRELTIIKKRG